jgi:nitrogen-specific signal transduction histidine kinase
MEESRSDTEFAPAERLDKEAIIKQNQEVGELPGVKAILNAIPEAVLILNQQRQIIFANNASINTLGMTEAELLEGCRPGELLSCDNAKRNKGGCGTSKNCSQCGAVLAILASQRGEEKEAECRISQEESGNAIDLKVKAAPFDYGGETFTIFSILDISDKKRREVLQRIFFHDILNTAGGLSGYSELLKMAEEGEETEEYRDIICDLSQKVISEITSQRQLLEAETGQLQPELAKLNSLDLLHSIINTYKQHEVTGNRKLIISPEAEPVIFNSDEALVSRVLGNLVKNALEASDESGQVTASLIKTGGQVEFSVHNQTMIPEKIQLQLFKRSFSTKGNGRGIGTYSVKLLTEKYLNGRVGFKSTRQKGTTFFVTFPLET